MTAADALLYQALEEIAEEVGEFSQEAAHYMPESPFADKGMVCSNCAFYDGPAECEIVEGEIMPGALCKFWIIPKSKLVEDMTAEQPPAEISADRSAETVEVRTLTGEALQKRFKNELVQTRELVSMAASNTEDDGLIRWEFSSEEPVDRWFGREVLSHAPGAADLSRLNNGGLHLWNHNRDIILGRVMEAGIGNDKRGKVATKWSPNTLERGSEEWKRRQDIESGITTKSSFAYEIREAVDMGEGGVLITKWQPLEVSTVSIPADNTVGHPPDGMKSREMLARSQSVEDMPSGSDPVETQPAEAVVTESLEPSVATVNQTITESTPNPTMTQQTASPPEDALRAAVDAEHERITNIQAMCKEHGMPESLADELVRSRQSVGEAQAVVLEKLGKRARELQPGGLHVESDALIGMDQKQLRQYSVVKLLRHLSDPSNNAYREQAAFELEISRATEVKADRSAHGAMIPFDWMIAQRDQQVGNFSKGGALVGTELLAGSFIDLLRNQSALLQTGITTVNGLTGMIDIPRKTAASQHYWVGEDDGVTNSDVSFGLISSTPKTIGVRVPVSRRMLIQSTPDIDTIVRSDMAESLALGVDASGLYGTGSSGQPLGLANVTGTGSVTLGGGASLSYPASVGGVSTHDTGDWADYINLQAACMVANVNTTGMRYIMNAITMAGGMQTLRASAAGSDYIISDAGNIGRFPTVMSNQVLLNDVFFGNYADLMLNTWSGLDVVVDNLTQAAKGQVIFTVMQDIDWVCRRPQSFAIGS
jgi:HK97 family phage major capsid protein